MVHEPAGIDSEVSRSEGLIVDDGDVGPGRHGADKESSVADGWAWGVR